VELPPRLILSLSAPLAARICSLESGTSPKMGHDPSTLCTSGSGFQNLGRHARTRAPDGGVNWAHLEYTLARMPPFAIQAASTSPRLAPIGSPTANLKGVLSPMKTGTIAERALLRQAFDLLLELRSRPDARKLLAKAVLYLRVLEHQGEPGELPLVVSIQALRVRDC